MSVLEFVNLEVVSSMAIKAESRRNFLTEARTIKKAWYSYNRRLRY